MCYVIIEDRKRRLFKSDKQQQHVSFEENHKMVTNSLLRYFSALFLMYHSASSVELTFDLPDSARECFHEDIKKNTSVVLEYQVRKRGNQRKFSIPALMLMLTLHTLEMLVNYFFLPLCVLCSFN